MNEDSTLRFSFQQRILKGAQVLQHLQKEGNSRTKILFTGGKGESQIAAEFAVSEVSDSVLSYYFFFSQNEIAL